ncbi:MAG: glutamine--tRNA ligase/YqeY domain fusion protein [Longimicrobiaceae bacterium]
MHTFVFQKQFIVNENRNIEQNESDARPGGTDFIRAIVAEDQRTGRYGGRVVTRFPPEPNGYLHIGHSKALVLNFGIAAEFGGRCHLRFDDTNPETEDIHYVESIIDTVRWLGFDWGEHLYFAADYFEEMYLYGEFLIQQGMAYVDSSSEEEIREYRGTVTEPGRPSRFRDRASDGSLDLFRRMRAAEFPDGTHVLRARIDMASPNMLLRDPIIYRIRHAHHYRTGDAWCIYPLYDYAHPIEDAIEGVTHSLCTLEFENNRALYDWVVEGWQEFERSRGREPYWPRQYEFARGNLDYTVMSKRKFLELVNGGYVSGWDDPRMPTLAGLRRRGVTPEAIRSFWERMGVAKANTRIDLGKLEYAIRDDLNQRAPRVLCVLRPLKVVVTNYPEGEAEELEAPYYPHDVPLEGSRKLPFSREIYIEREDFMENPPKGFHRLTPGGEVRLRYAYIIRCDEVIKDEAGEVVELRCSYDRATRGGTAPDGRTIRGTIHWVSAEHSLPCEVRLYDRLFTVPNPEEGDDFKEFLNPQSLVVVEDARVEPSVANDPPGWRYQFERQGYFCSDIVDSKPGSLVFNRTVTLRDTWAKVAQRPHPLTPSPTRGEGEAGSAGASSGAAVQSPLPPWERGGEPKRAGVRASEPTRVARAPELEARLERYVRELELSEYEAEILTRDAGIADLFEATIGDGVAPKSVANWIINDLLTELKTHGITALNFDAGDLRRLIALVEEGTISSSAGKEVLAELVEKGGDPAEIVEQRGLKQISDPEELGRVVEAVLAANADKVAAYRAGKTGLLGFFMGQVMGRTKGRANPELAKEMLESRLQAAAV